jgi:hypothetical protein
VLRKFFIQVELLQGGYNSRRFIRIDTGYGDSGMDQYVVPEARLRHASQADLSSNAAKLDDGRCEWRRSLKHFHNLSWNR